MSVAVMNAVLDAAAPLTQSEAIVLLVLARYADDDGGRCWPSQATIAAKARATERGVRNILARLQSRNLLTVTPPAGTRSARYQIRLETLARPEPDSPLADIQTGTGFPSSPERGSPLHGSARRNNAGETGTPRQLDRNATTARPEPGSGDPLDPSVISPDQDQPSSTAPLALEPEQSELVPFSHYAAIATSAIAEANRRHTADRLEIVDIFKTECAKQGKPYNGEVAHRAIDAAEHARNKRIAALVSSGRSRTA